MVLLSSCLNTESESQLTEERALNNATNLYITSVASLYNNVGGTQDGEGLQGTYRGVYDYNTFTTDEAIIPSVAATGTMEGFGKISICTSGRPMIRNCKRCGTISSAP